MQWHSKPGDIASPSGAGTYTLPSSAVAASPPTVMGWVAEIQGQTPEGGVTAAAGAAAGAAFQVCCCWPLLAETPDAWTAAAADWCCH